MTKVLLSISLITLLFVSSCKLGCKIEDKLVPGVTVGLTTVLNCKNRSAVEADVKKMADKLHLCDEQLTQGFICQQLAMAAVNLLGTALPKTWDCAPQDSVTLQAAVSLACAAAPF